MTCSVVIPCHNRADLTRACLQSLQHQVAAPDLEILVVDNGSHDGTSQLTGSGVRVLSLRENLGFAAGVNHGLRHARGDTVLVLNNDTQLASNALHELHRALDRDRTIAAAGAVSNEVKGHAQIEVGRRGESAAGRRQIADDLRSAPRLQDVTTLSGLCLLLRRTALDTVGVFDERFGHGNFEDDDLCLRLRLHGHRLVLARRAFVHHEGHATFSALGLDVFAEIRRRRLQFDAKWQSDPAGRATIAALDDDPLGAGAAAEDGRLAWPRWADADWHLGRAAAAQRDPQRAARHFTALLRHCPQHVDAQLALGACQLEAGLPEAAQATFEFAARQPLSRVQQQYLLEQLGAHAYRSGRPGDAAASFRAAAALGGDPRGILHNWIGLCQLATGQLDAAERTFTTAAEQGHGIAHTNLGICAYRRGDLAAARQRFATACERAPDDPVARANYAKLCELVPAG